MKTYFVIATTNGRDLDYWRFDTAEEAWTFVESQPFDRERYKTVSFQTIACWVPAS